MIDLQGLADLAASNPDALRHPVAPIRLGERVVDSDGTPVVMGIINLSPDSSYRDSIATSTASVVRRGKVLAAQGADLIDLGAESTNATAERVGADRQIELLVPAIEGLVTAGLVVSTEAYDPAVARACLEAGAQVLNYTGHAADDEIFDLTAEHGATLVLCSILGSDSRDVTDVEREADPLPGYLDHFEKRIATARARGVEDIVLDPGLGFFYGNLTDPVVRLDYQTRVLLRTFELRVLGLPICQSLPSAYTVFEEQFRIAEPFFSVLARLAGTGMLRTHEVPQVRAMADTMQRLGVSTGRTPLTDP